MLLYKTLIALGILYCVSAQTEVCETPYEVISKDPTLSLVKGAIDAAGLKDLLDDPDLNATIFIPENSGIQEFLEDAGASVEDLLSFPQLDILLAGHVLPGKPLTTVDLQEGVDYETLVGEDSHIEVTFKRENDPRYAQCGDGVHMHITSHSVRDSDPIRCDIQACNSIIHIIDYPLLPHSEEFEKYFPGIEISHGIHMDEDEEHDDHDDMEEHMHGD